MENQQRSPIKGERSTSKRLEIREDSGGLPNKQEEDVLCALGKS